MSEYHWMQDDRKIRRVKLAGNGQIYPMLDDACCFERFEHNGEYCMLPWIRLILPSGKQIEAPLTQVELIEYEPVA
jgi:hypothetical protein